MTRVHGFTLIEILVVMFIIAIMTGIAVIKLPSFTVTDDFDTESRRLLAVLQMARDEDLYQADELGFRPERHGYRFFVYDDVKQSWTELAESPFSSRQLPDDVELDLEVEGDALTLSPEDGDDDGSGRTPPVLILSSGEITPFRLRLRSPAHDLSETLVSDGYGDFAWDTGDEAQ